MSQTNAVAETRPQTEDDNFVIVGGRTFLVDKSPEGWWFTCTGCLELLWFGPRAQKGSIDADLSAHECKPKHEARD